MRTTPGKSSASGDTPHAALVGLVALLALLAMAGVVLWRSPYNPSRATASVPPPRLADSVRLDAAATDSEGQPVRGPSPLPTARPLPPASAEQIAAAAPAGGVPMLTAKIEIVWPHGNASVRDANLANVTAYLIQDGNNPPPCDWQPVVRLWAALNSQPARAVAVGERRMYSGAGRTFPVWDFNDVDVSAARDPANRLSLFVTVDGMATRHNVWVHASDARTVFPQPDQPAGTVATQPGALDARIEIVWPHGGAASRSSLANATVYLFQPDTLQALPSDGSWKPTVRLHWALNNAPDQGDASDRVGEPRSIPLEGGRAFLAWDFNNLDISPAQDTLNKLHFWATVDGTATFSNVWTHAAAPATLYPQADLLASCQ